MTRPTRAEQEAQITEIKAKLVAELHNHSEISFRELLEKCELPLMSTLARVAMYRLTDDNDGTRQPQVLRDGETLKLKINPKF